MSLGSKHLGSQSAWYMCIVPFDTKEHGHSWDVTEDRDEESTEDKLLILHCVPRLDPHRKLQHLLGCRVQKRVHVLGFVWAWNLAEAYHVIIVKTFGWGKIVVIDEEWPTGCLSSTERANAIGSEPKCNVSRVFIRKTAKNLSQLIYLSRLTLAFLRSRAFF